MVWFLGIAAVLLGIGFLDWLVYMGRCLDQPPVLDVRAWLGWPARPERCVLCLGDSLTHGHVGADWVSPLRSRWSAGGVGVVNAGLNGDLAWNVGQRLERALAVEPEAITLLIGSKDAMGCHRADRARGYRRSKGLPQLPDHAFFEACLDSLLGRLAQTGVPVAVLTLPPLGDDPAQDPSGPANDALGEAVARHGLTLLDLRAALAPLTTPGGPPYAGGLLSLAGPMLGGVARHYTLGTSWDQLAGARGSRLFIDGVHFSDRAAAVVLDLVDGWLRTVLVTDEDEPGMSGESDGAP